MTHIEDNSDNHNDMDRNLLKISVIFVFLLLGGCCHVIHSQTPKQSSTAKDSTKTAIQTPEKREILYLRSNLLAPLTNLGAEIGLGNHWSVGADYYFPWMFRNPNHKNCFQLLGLNLEGRYWFGKERTYEDRLEGHSVGINLGAGYYDFERNFKGNQGEFATIGVDYLYSLPVCKDRLHLEFSLGLGWIYSRVKPYEVYSEGGKAYKLGYEKNFNWYGPTKAGVSLVVPIKAKRRSGR